MSAAAQSQPNPDAFCCNCQEDFPVGDTLRMGQLVPLAKVPARIRDRFRSWADHEDGAYLCGNCYFDILDAEDER